MLKPVPDCCKPVETNPERKGFFWGILYGLMPHTFCIFFVFFAVIGATTGTVFLKRFLVIQYFFQFLVGLSLVFATISAIIYLKKSGNLSIMGLKRKWRYLTILFLTTIGINLLSFYIIFPVASNIGSSSVTGSAINSDSSKVEMINGVQVVRMTQTGRGYTPNVFTIKKGIPTKWIITGTNTGFCSSNIVSRQLNIQKDLDLGENIFEFTPDKVGKIKFSCIMGMYTGYFNVID